MINFRKRLLSTTLLAGTAAMGTPAYAQDAAGSSGAQPPADSAQPAPAGPDASQPPAPASTPAPSAQPASTGPSIVVTGTRIPQPNLTSAAPVQVVTNQDVKLTGTTRVEDLLAQLPSTGASQVSGMSNGASGTAEIDLRYLGSKRSLTLVNGRRLTPGDPNSTTQAADLNIIPSALIKRVEVLTGGASSVYGADAVAGVVNFIMDDSFTGVRFDGQYSFYQHNNRNPFVANCVTGAGGPCGTIGAGGAVHIRDALNARGYAFPRGSVADGGTFDGTMSLGARFDDGRGHVMAYFGYRKVNAVLESRRDYSACTIQNTSAGNPQCGGSATANPGNALWFQLGQTSSTIGALGPGALTANRTNTYNFAPLNYYQRPDERYIGGAYANYEINDSIKPYLELMFMDDRTLAQIAPSGDFANTFTINCDNPFMSAQQRTELCNPSNLIVGYLVNFPVAAGANYNPGLGTTPINFVDPVTGQGHNIAFFNLLRRNTEGGPRINDLKHISYHGVLGSRGDISKVWSYDAFFQYGKTNYTQVFKNEFSARRLNFALDAVVNPSTGEVVCRAVLQGIEPNCAPYDVFSGNPPSAAALKYLNVFGVIDGQTSEQIANVNFTGALGEMGIQTPWSDEGVGVNFGTEYRKESLDLNPDQSFQTGDLTGQGGPTLPVNGNFRVLEIFGEAQIPIIRHAFVEEFSLGLGYRKSWYKLKDGRKYDTDTFKISAELAPVRDIRFRGSYNRAVRAPNIQELYTPQFVGNDGSNDPCLHTILPTDYGCLAQGLHVGQTPVANPAAQYNGLLGGNPNLKPEKATTKTVGLVAQPRFLPRFALTLDYWNIDLRDAIQGFGADAIVANCSAHSTATSIAPSCSLIKRDPGGSLWVTQSGWVVDTPNNVGRIKTDGWDIGTTYSHRLGSIGNLSAAFNGTYLHKYKVANGLEGGVYDCAGLYGPTCSGASVASSSPMPRWRHRARLTLQMPNGIGASLQWRYVGKVTAETLDPSETLHGANNFQPGLHIAAQNYFDLASTFTIGDHYNLRLGVNNLFDRGPPLVTSGSASKSGSSLCAGGPCNGNTYPAAWDTLGRYIFAGATLNF